MHTFQTKQNWNNTENENSNILRAVLINVECPFQTYL